MNTRAPLLASAAMACALIAACGQKSETAKTADAPAAPVASAPSASAPAASAPAAPAPAASVPTASAPTAPAPAAPAPTAPAPAAPAPAAPATAAPATAASAQQPPAAAASAGTDGGKPYKVVDGYKVDPDTMEGFRTWRAAACDRCHGANQEGMVGPSLVDSLKVLSKEDFKKTLTEGRLEKGMPSRKENKQVMENIDKLYAYLKGRSDGAITRAKVEPIQ